MVIIGVVCLQMSNLSFLSLCLEKKSLTYKNGPEARKKRQLVDRSFGHEAVTHYYDHFTKVLLLLQCSVPILW